MPHADGGRHRLAGARAVAGAAVAAVAAVAATAVGRGILGARGGGQRGGQQVRNRAAEQQRLDGALQRRSDPQRVGWQVEPRELLSQVARLQRGGAAAAIKDKGK